MNNFLNKFNTVYIIYFLLLLTFPGSGNQSFSIGVICFLIIFGFILVVNFSFILYPNNYLITTIDAVHVSPSRLKIFTLVAFLGLLSYMFDRVFLLGVDYTTGLASARYQLLEITENTTSKGVKSIFSLVGNILIPFSFWNLVFLLKNDYESLNKSFYIITNSIIVVTSSLLFGGRTNILLYLLIILILRKKKEKSTSSLKLNLVKFFGIFSLFFLVGYVFYDRADANESIAVEYLVDMLSFLRGGLYYDFYIQMQHLDSLWSAIISIMLMIDAYFIHSFWVFTDILHQNNEGIIFGQNYIAIISKFIDIETPSESSTAGVFIGLPGGIYYDYGYIGLCFLAIINICLVKFLNICYHQRNYLFKLGFVILICLQTVYLASPFIIISDIYMFPAFLFAGIIYSFFINIKRT